MVTLDQLPNGNIGSISCPKMVTLDQLPNGNIGSISCPKMVTSDQLPLGVTLDPKSVPKGSHVGGVTKW